LNWIQISLQIIKRFEKEKDFLIPIWQWAETQLEAEPGPTNFSFFAPISLFSRGAADSALEPPQSRPNAPAAVGRSGHWVWTRSTNPLARIWRNKRTFDLFGLKPDPNPSSYPLSHSFKIKFIPFPISPYPLRFIADFKID
jgi:hypothetical protein